MRTDTPVRGIARVVVEAAVDGLRVRIESAGGPGPADWGVGSVGAVYAASPEGKTGVAFTARYGLPPVTLDLHANLSKGLLIVASMARFPDRRRGEFAREFFRKVDSPAIPQEG